MSKQFRDMLSQGLKKKGYSIRRLAREIDVSDGYLSRVLNGIYEPPSEEVIVKISEALGLDAIEFLGAAGRVESRLQKSLAKAPEMARIVSHAVQGGSVSAEWFNSIANDPAKLDALKKASNTLREAMITFDKSIKDYSQKKG